MSNSPVHEFAVGPLLETKLYIPRWRLNLISRPRLIERLHQTTERKLTLISAPAGFGKTTLLTEWLATIPTGQRACAWVSLDQRDNDPIRFWSYVIAALQKLQPGVGETALSLLQSPQPPQIESIITTLINELTAIEDNFALVLDDFHVIDAQSIHHAIDFLLDYLPPQMHLVVASRSDPPLSLARLRGRGEAIELRAADLRFSHDEAAAFLNEAMGLNLSETDVANLEMRTEGWVAGLQLAALSMQGRENIPEFIRTFAGDHRYIVDYLVDEVLRLQPDDVRSFLLETSILERLSGPLCDAVTGRENSKEVLAYLERGNVFLVPLDDKRVWFRYHQLFADVLQAHAMEEESDHILSRHIRASEWYERNGLLSDAIRHALAAEDFERAADLAELAWPAMDRSRRSAAWLTWVNALPDERVRIRPVLSLAYAWALLQGGELDAGEARLKDAERWLGTTTDMNGQPAARSDEMVVMDHEEFQFLPASIAAARAFHAQALGDVPGTVMHARQALDSLPEGELLRRGSPAALLALASWANGDLEVAGKSLTDAIAGFEMAGNVLFAITGAYVLAEIRKAQGRLHDALGTYEQSLQLAALQRKPLRRGTADLHTGLSDLYREWNDQDSATQHLQRSKELGEHAGLPHWPYRWCLAQARMVRTEGDLSGALALLDEAERQYVTGPVPDVRPISAWRARVWIAQNELNEAINWVSEQGLSVDDDLSYLREFEHITLARVLVAQYASTRAERSIDEALGLLERLRKAAEEGQRTGSVIEILLLQALADHARGNVCSALSALERALNLAEPEGYVRAFVDEGEAMQDLLRHAVAGGIGGAYARRLLSAFGEPGEPVYTKGQVAVQGLAEPLTPREIEILRLIAAGMRNQDIADHLFISLATVKRHIANAYGKLGVGHRTEALIRANELNLL